MAETVLWAICLAEADDDGAWLAPYRPDCCFRAIEVRERHVEDDLASAARTWPSGSIAALAIDQRFMGYLAKRATDTLREIGISMPALVHPRAYVDASARLEEGVRIAAGALIGHRAQIAAHTRVLEGAVIGRDCRVGPHGTIDPGVVLGEGASVGAHGWLRSGVVLGPCALVGSACELLIPGRYTGPIAEGTLQLPELAQTARILRFG